MIDDRNPPAFPLPAMLLDDGRGYPAQPGMTLRDYFAGQAIGDLLRVAASGDLHLNGSQSIATAVAEQAYLLADAMLAERAKVGAQ